MKTIEEKNFDLFEEFALSGEEMLNVRGGIDGDGGDGGEGGEGDDGGEPPVDDPGDSDPERPPVIIVI